MFNPFTCWATLNSGCNKIPCGALSYFTIEMVKEPSTNPPNQNL